MRRKVVVVAAVLSAVVMIVLCMILVSCGSSSGSSNRSSQYASVNTTLSDPPTCGSAQGGQFAHIYVAIKDVQINASSNAGDNDAGWIDLTPSLKSGSPKQVDLLGLADNNCFLATLGSTTQIQPGTYQQIRVFLADNSTSISGNQCGSAGANCVVLNSDLNHPRTLQLSSEAKSGIKIPSGQLAGGKFVVGAGETKDLNIDFNACASIVQEGNGQYRLKPVLHAGEVTLTSQSINGTVLNGQTTQPINGNVVVALEQKDSATGIDRVIMETVPDAQGHFVFCPVPAGTYDLVVAAVDNSGNEFAATVTTGLQPGNAAGNIPMYYPATVNKSAAVVTGLVTTSTGSAATSADVSVSALQQVGSILVTIPLATQSASAVVLSTSTGSSCPSQTDCATYDLSVPAANPTVGAFSTNGTTYTADSGVTIAYTVDAQASVPGSGGQSNCTNAELTTNKQKDGTSALNVTAGAQVTAATLAFTGCQ